MSKKSIILSLVLPVFNEEKNLEKVFLEISTVLKKANISFELIFVEGGSKDKSYLILRELEKKHADFIKVFQTGIGPGEKIHEGFKQAKGKYVGIISSDGQDDASIIPKCVDILEKERVDFVKGTRPTRENFNRLFVSRSYNLIARLLFDLESKDINGHPKIFRKKIIPSLNLKIKDEWIDLECLIRAKDLNLKTIEIPVVEKKRESGRSTADLNSTLRFFKHVFVYMFLNYH